MDHNGQQQQEEQRRQEEEAEAVRKSLAIAAYADHHIQRDRNGWQHRQTQYFDRGRDNRVMYEMPTKEPK